MWPGYYRTKALLEPVLTEIPRMRIDPDQEPNLMFETLTGKYYASSKNFIRSANGRMGIEDFEAGATLTWMFPHDEFHWILKGKAEMTYSLAGTSHTEQETVTIQEGDIFLIPLGARVTWKIDPSSRLRRVAVVMPGPANSSLRPQKVG